MTVPSDASSSTHVGNGVTTSFNTGFYFLDATEVVVKLTPSGGAETVKTLGVHYTVTMPASVGAVGAVVMLTAPASGDVLLIERTVPMEQGTSFRTQGSFSPATHEDAFDESVFRDQQLDRRVKALESAGAPGSVVAGDGLVFSGTTLHVQAGGGIEVYPDEVGVSWATVVPTAVTASAGSIGTGGQVARSDHRHQVSTDVALDLVPGDAASAGTSSSLARADHVHGAPVDVPEAIDCTPLSEGTSSAFSRADHKHDVNVGTAVSLTDSSNAEGSASTLARSDHTHSHGARGGGTLHAAATTSAAGFLSAADKTILDALAAVRSHVHAYRNSAQTINHDTDTTLIFNTERWDVKNEFDATTGVFTAAVAGFYLVNVGVTLNGNGADTANTNVAQLTLVGGAAGAVVQGSWVSGVDAGTLGLQGSAVFYLTAGQTIYANLYHYSQTSSSRTASSDTGKTFITIDRID